MTKKKQKTSRQKAKEKAWKLFSIYIRRRHTDEHGYATCVTCDHRDHWKKMQAGHFLPGRTNAILFDEMGCFTQCYACNIRKQGNAVEYFLFMENNFGREEIDRQRKLKQTVLKRTEQDYLDLMAKYQAKIDMIGEE